MSKGLTLTIIFESQSLNYGEGTGTILVLKKMTRDNGMTYSYASRQALRYDIVRLGNQYFGWQKTPVDSAQGAVQFSPTATIKDYPEIDFFGYMKTKSKKESETGGGADTRPATVRLSPAVSLEPFMGDIEFATNKGLADRIPKHPDPYQPEQHLSFYAYTVTIDLDRIGVDGKIDIGKSNKISRVKQLLEIIKILNREIRASDRNLNPLFVIGGIYDIKNPFFMGRLKLEWKGSVPSIAITPIKETLSVTFKDKAIGSNTNVGIVSGIWGNEEELKQLPVKKPVDIETFFSELAGEVQAFYEGA